MIIALENIRSLYNIGAIMRTSEFLGFKEIALLGYSGRDTLEPDLIHQRIKKTSMTAIQNLQITHYDNIDELLSKYPNYNLICIENNTPNTKPLSEIQISNESIILFGNEVEGISTNALSKASSVNEIPRVGTHPSLNVEATAAIVLNTIREKSTLR